MKRSILEKQTITIDNTRDYLFDNLRAVLILLVVWGHILTSLKSDYNSARSVYIFVFFFHMPAMVFISGYFSKNLEKIRSNAFITILIPYLILNFINYLFRSRIIHDVNSGYRFFQPYWGLWYLLVLFIWRFFLKDIIKMRFLMPISIVIAVLCGWSKEFSEYMALGRVIYFLPFFLLGYYCTAEHITKIRKLPKLLGVVVVVVVASVSMYLSLKKWFKIEYLLLRKPYAQDEQLKGMLIRILIYIIAFAMIIAITNLMTARKNFLSYIGTSTLTIYVLHLFTIPVLAKIELFRKQPYLYLVYSFFIAALIVYIYSLPFVKKGYDLLMDKLTGLLIRKDTGTTISK